MSVQSPVSASMLMRGDDSQLQEDCPSCNGRPSCNGPERDSQLQEQQQARRSTSRRRRPHRRSIADSSSSSSPTHPNLRHHRHRTTSIAWSITTAAVAPTDRPHATVGALPLKTTPRESSPRRTQPARGRSSHVQHRRPAPVPMHVPKARRQNGDAWLEAGCARRTAACARRCGGRIGSFRLCRRWLRWKRL